jgi:hypothetical protein
VSNSSTAATHPSSPVRDKADTGSRSDPVHDRRNRLLTLLTAPISLRRLHQRASALGIVGDNANGYFAIINDLKRLRGSGAIADDIIILDPRSARGHGDRIASLNAALVKIVEKVRPATVRQVFYQATVRGLVEKSERGYKSVQRALTTMRRSGELDYGWIIDNTRTVQAPWTHDSIEDALEYTADHYRKALWADADCRVQVWLEKDALSGVIYPTTAKYDVPLMVARGYASLSFLHEAAETIADIPTFIYHLGDFDPSGVNAGENIEATLRELAPDADITFERIAVTKEQIDEWKLPTRPTKQSDTRAAGFGDISVELDAIDPDQLRSLVQEAIERHLPPKEYRRLMKIEKLEQATIRELVEGLS